MKVFLLFLPLFVFGVEYGLKPVKVTQNVTCYFGAPEVINTTNNGNMVNSCFIDVGEYLIVVDSGPTYLYAKEAYTKLSTTKKVRYVINTHKHDDHYMGNGFYKQQGAVIYGSKLIEMEEKPRMQRSVLPEFYEGTKQVLPDVRVDGRVEIGEVLVDKPSLIGHTRGDLIVYFPKDGVVFGGDLIFNDRILSLRDGDIKGWLLAIEKIRSLYPKYIVGGHGKNTTKNAYVMTKEYLETLHAKVKKAYEDGVEIGEITKSVKLEEYKDIPLYNELNSGNVFKAYQIIEFEE